jgi:beta-alanine degradation protein BauB
MKDHPVDDLRRALLAAMPALLLAQRASAQDASRVQPQSYRNVLENERMRVLEFNSRPGMGVCGNGMHSHPAHLTVLLSSARVRETLQDGKVQLAREQPLGDVFWSPPITHQVENLSGHDVRALIIELKA